MKKILKSIKLTVHLKDKINILFSYISNKYFIDINYLRKKYNKFIIDYPEKNKINIKLIIYKNKELDLILLTPSVYFLILKIIDKRKNKQLTILDIIKIAKIKQIDLFNNSLSNIVLMIKGTLKSINN